MSGLPRDILRWIQSLDLSFSVKNVKRDFSNGYLTAEILSRYFKHEISLHAFENATSTLKKQVNWELIIKFSNKNAFPITQQMADEVMNCLNNAAVELIELLYTTLTQKTVQRCEAPAAEATSPAFARPTASQLVKDTLKLAGTIAPVDYVATSKASQEVVEQQIKANRQERIDNPSRFQPKSPPPKIIRGTARQIGTAESELPQMSFVKEVSVKSVEDITARSRSHHTANTSMQGSVKALASPQLGNTSDFPVNSTKVNLVAVLTILNSFVVDKIGKSELSNYLNPRIDPFVSFLDNLSRFPSDFVISFFNELTSNKSSVLAESVLASPKEFWTFFSLFYPALSSLGNETTEFRALVELVKVVGEIMISKDQYVPFALFTDFCLAKVCDLMKNQPLKIHAVSTIIYSFCVKDTEEHVKVVNKLEEILNDSSFLVHILSILVELEAEFSEKLFEVYSYHALLGVRSKSPYARTGGLSILTFLLPYDHELKFILQIFPILTDLRTDTWWEVLAQLSVLTCSMLHVMEENHPAINNAYSIIDQLLNSDGSSPVLKITLSNVSPILSLHPSLLVPFVDILLLRQDARELLDIYGNHNVAMPDSIRGVYSLVALPHSWFSLGIALTIANQVKDSNLGNIGLERIELLSAVVTNLINFPNENPDLEQWKEIFEILMEYILVELCEEKVVDLVISILKKFLLDPMITMTARKIFISNESGAAPPLFGMFKFLFGSEITPEIVFCGKSVCKFLIDLAVKQDMIPPIVALLKQFASSEPEVFGKSELNDVLLHLENASKLSKR